MEEVLEEVLLTLSGLAHLKVRVAKFEEEKQS